MKPNSWSVTIPEFNNGIVKKRNEVWQGANTAFPNSQSISKFLSEDTPNDIVSDVAVQFIKKAPIQALPNLLTCLVCNYWRAADVNIGSPQSPGRKAIDPKMLQGIAESAQRSVCGVVFKKGDIVWTCRTCAKDPTSVQCDKCFRKSNHQDHEVFFHRAGGDSGCCDCGDPEAWSIAGNCLDHSHPSKANQLPTDADLHASVPPELTKGLRAVLKGAIGLVVSCTVSLVRGYEKWEDNQFINPRPNTYSRNDTLIGRLHNDDVHSMDQVVSGLVACSYPRQQAAKLTEQVDKDGEATVVTAQANDPKLLTTYRRLRLESGLLFSMVPDYIVALEQRVQVTLQWMLSLGLMSDGLRRIVSEELLCEVGQLYSNASAFGPSDDVESALLAVNVFADTVQFPTFLSHLHDPPVPSLPLSGPVFANPRGGSFDGSYSQNGTSEEEDARFSTMDADTDFPNRLVRPFDRCHHNAFGILMMASPFLSKALKRSTIDIVIKFQHDALFKSCFSQMLTVLYPAICVLYCRNIGTQDSCIFQTTVQVYTANSIVALMASDGVRNRLLPEGGRPIMITKMFMSTFIAVLRDVGCKLEIQHVLADNETSFLSHHSIRTHRISQICRDMEYVTSDSYFCARLLRGDVDYGMIGDILIICSLLQCIDSHRRHTLIHVERENDSWQDAANLVLEFESLTTHLVSGALFDPSSRKSDKSSQFSYSKHSDVNEDLVKIRQEGALKCISSAMNRLKAWCDEYGTAEADRSLYFYSAGTTENLMGHPVVFHGLKRFQVSRSAVSVHLPLHRFVGKVVKFAAYSNGSLSAALELLCKYDISGRVHFADYPLRCLSFASQVAAGMWRRNGSTAANLAYNYNRAPLSKALRDMDVLALQISLYTLSPDSLLALAMDRYELSTMLQNYTTFYLPETARLDSTTEYKAPLLSEFLKLLIITLTNPPTSLIESSTDPSRAVEGIHRALSREVVHQVLTGVQSAGNMQRVKVMVGHVNTVSDAMLSAVIDDVCIRKQASEDGGSRVLVLKPESYALYDPEYVNLSNQQISTAADAIRDHLKALISESGSGNDATQKFIALMQPQALPIPCEEFASMRTVMYRPLFFTLLQRSLRLVLDNPNATSTSRVSIVSRVIQLVTMQIMCRDTAVSPPGCGFINRDAWTHGARYFIDAFKDTSDNMEEDPMPNGPVMVRSNSNLTKLTSGMVSTSSSNLADLAAMSVSTDESESDASLVGAGRHLLSALADVWNAGIVKEDLLYHHGLGWILQQIASNSVDGNAVLKSKGISFDVSNASAEDAEKARRAKLRQAAQQRALLESQKRAAAFAISMEDSEEEDDDDNESEEGTEGFVKPEKEVEPECIVCREKKTDQAIGYLCFIQPSNVLKNMMKRNLDFPQLSKLYRVVANDGCTVYSGRSVDSKVVMRLHQGDHVLIDHRQGRWVQLVSPVSGWCVLYSHHEDQAVALAAKKKVDGKSDDMTVFLHPVQDLLYNKHGGTRLHISQCGHTMHFECWNMLYAANYSRYINGHRSLDYQAMDIERNESLCPFCKSVTNSLIPYVSKRKAAELLPLKASGAAVDNSESSKMAVEGSDGPSFSSFLHSSSAGDLFKNPCRSLIEKNAKGDMFIQSCKLLNNLPWSQKSHSRGETEFAKLCQSAENSGIGAMRLLHFVWSASAYTIQNLTVQLMKDRSERGAISADLEGTASSVSFAEGDATLVFHLLSTLRYAPSWFDQMDEFGLFVSTPLGQLVSGIAVHSLTADCKRVDALQCGSKDVEKCLFTIPYRTVATAGYPDHLTVSQIQAVALEKGVAKSNIYALLKVPLLSQDLHVILVAAASAASDLQSFQSTARLLILARLSQILLEPASTGLAGSSFSHSSTSSASIDVTTVNPHEKSDNNGNAMVVDGGELHSPMTANENRKRLKVESNSQHTEEWLSANKVLIGDFLTTVESVRLSVSGLVPPRNASQLPSDAELAELILDSWIPYLEYCYLITRSMTTICNNRQSSVPAVPESVDSLCGSIGNKISYSKSLLSALGIESLADTLRSEECQQLVHRWISQFQSYFGTAPSTSSTKDKRSRAPSKDVWIPHVRAVPSSKASKTGSGSAAKKKDGKDPQGLLGLAADQNEFDNILSYLSGNTASDLIAGNASSNPTPNSAVGNQQNPGWPEGLRRSLRNRPPPPAAAAAPSGAVAEEPPSAMDEVVDESESEAPPATRPPPHPVPGEFEWDAQEDDYFYDLDSSDGTSDGMIHGDSEEEDDEEGRMLQAPENIDEGDLRGLDENMIEELIQSENFIGFDEDSNQLRQEILNYFRTHGVAGGSGGDGRKKLNWRLYGVDPSNEFVDETSIQESLSSFLTRQPLQGSVSGAEPVFGVNGETLTHAFPDLSHFGMGIRHVQSVFVELPPIYTDLYQMTKFPEGSEGITLDDPAICLVCGRILNAGNRQSPGTNSAEHHGECTLHTQQCGAGVGVFFLVQACTVLLIRGALSCYYPTFYLDSSGEVNENRNQNRPLFLSAKRYKKLEELYVTHKISKEIARKRSTADSVVRQNWY